MQKIRTGLLVLSAFYLGSALWVTAQTMERRVTVVEQQASMNSAMTQTALDRIQALEVRVTQRDLLIEGRLVALERSIANFGQLLLAVGAGVLIQLVTSAIGGLRASRLRQGP